MRGSFDCFSHCSLLGSCVSQYNTWGSEVKKKSSISAVSTSSLATECFYLRKRFTTISSSGRNTMVWYGVWCRVACWFVLSLKCDYMGMGSTMVGFALMDSTVISSAAINSAVKGPELLNMEFDTQISIFNRSILVYINVLILWYLWPTKKTSFFSLS